MLPAAAGDGVPDLRGFCALVSGGADPRPVRELHAWLSGLDAAAPLGELVGQLFPSPGDAEWLRALDDQLAARAAAALALRLGPALDEALALSATRVSALGLSDEIRARGSGVSVLDSPFYRLPRALDDD